MSINFENIPDFYNFIYDQYQTYTSDTALDQISFREIVMPALEHITSNININSVTMETIQRILEFIEITLKQYITTVRIEDIRAILHDRRFERIEIPSDGLCWAHTLFTVLYNYEQIYNRYIEDTEITRVINFDIGDKGYNNYIKFITKHFNIQIEFSRDVPEKIVNGDLGQFLEEYNIPYIAVTSDVPNKLEEYSRKNVRMVVLYNEIRDTESHGHYEVWVQSPTIIRKNYDNTMIPGIFFTAINKITRVIMI